MELLFRHGDSCAAPALRAKTKKITPYQNLRSAYSALERLGVKPSSNYAISAVNAFLQRDIGYENRGGYKVTEDSLIWTRTLLGRWSKDRRPRPVTVTVAKRVSGIVYGNSSPISGQSESRQLQIQEVCRMCGAFMLPFKLLEERGFRLEDVEFLDQGKEQTLERWGRKTHFAGALLFKAKDRTYLIDIDQEDAKHNVANGFMVTLPRHCTTIADAYDSLMPDEVRDAVARGDDVKRQGEWFFIPVDTVNDRVPGLPADPKWIYRLNKVNDAAVLKSKGSRSHYVRFRAKDGIHVSGMVSHGGHEHTPFVLNGWHKPVPNTAVESYKIEGGMID